jgi:hypothetical protein
VLNHDDDGAAAVVSHADGATTIEAMDEVDATTERIRTYLLKATQLTASGTKKKCAIELLERELGRGRWSIRKMLVKQGILTHRGKGGGN